MNGTIITAPDTATVTAVLDTQSGKQRAAIGNPACQVLAAGMRDVLSGVLISPGRLINPGLAGSRPPFNFSPPQDWGTLHPFELAGMGYKDAMVQTATGP